MKSYKKYKIAIDGPAGSGKSTIAKIIAQKFGFLYIDSGAMYRAITLYLYKNKLLDSPEHKLKSYIKKVKISFLNKRNKQLVLLNKKDVTYQIRSSKINKLVSEVSSKKIIRNAMVKQQREFALENSVVMDGRDIGTNVFKDADLKIYLTAKAEVRAKRRKKDLEKIGEKISFKELIKEIHSRDNYDSSRKFSPLSKAQDAIVIDSTNLNINEVCLKINFFLPQVIR